MYRHSDVWMRSEAVSIGECSTYIDEPIPKTLFYEPYSDRFFESTIVDVMQAEYRNICQN